MQYQEQNNLQATGRPDQETLSRLGIDASADTVERRPAAVEPTPASEPQMDSRETAPVEQKDGALYEEEVEVQQESVNSDMLNEEADTN